MSRLAFITFAATLSACASAPTKQVAAASSPVAAPCPKIVIDGAAQPSTCAPAKRPTAKCDPNGPTIVVDGVVVDCVKPDGDR